MYDSYVRWSIVLRAFMNDKVVWPDVDLLSFKFDASAAGVPNATKAKRN